MTDATTPTSDRWWRECVVYQVYLRSFADGNGDGTGDIAGLRSRLPHLADLGVDAIWINPWYTSPLLDGGYDVADYRDIDPRYGTLAEAEALIADAHDHGIRVIADLVPNHTSWEHRWFVEARNAPVGDPSRARYHIRPGAGPDGSLPPTDWTSVFGGPAWTRLDDGEWYLHLFDVSQPDLDWSHPEVRDEFDDVLRFWLDRDVDGFRVDVAHGLVKDPAFPDLAESPELLGGVAVANHPYWDRDGVHEIIRRWRAVLDAHRPGLVLVAEAWVEGNRRPLYVRPDEYHQAFDFSFMGIGWEKAEMKRAIGSALRQLGSVGSIPCWTMSNHDVMRHATRYGLPNDENWRRWPTLGDHTLLDESLGRRRARAAALLLLALPGSVYLYQGEELGLGEVWDLPPEVLDDPVWERSNGLAKGRDGCRVPIPWTTDGPSFGFGDAAPWLPQPDDWGAMSAQAQTGVDGSFLELYRAALALRREHITGGDEIEWLELGRNVMGFVRSTGVACIVNFRKSAVDLPDGEVLLSSLPLAGGKLPSDGAAWVQLR